MAKQIRNLGVFLVVLYSLLFVQINRVTVFGAEELREHPTNNREIERDYSSPRGSISTADGVVIAESVESGDEYEYQRLFPAGPLYAHITGYYGFNVGAAGLEESYNDELTGGTIDFDLQDIGEVFVDRERVGNLTLSVRDDVQRVAQSQLGEREGSVVALDPRSGAVYGMWSFPSFDPNALSTHDFAAATDANQQLDEAPGNPKRSRAYRDRFFPGSTFKIVTATAGIERGGVTPDEPEYPEVDSYQPSSGSRLHNFEGHMCGGRLFEILQRSCNAAFAQMGVEHVGGEDMVDTAEAFGFNEVPPIDLPNPVESTFPASVTNPETGEETSLDDNPGILAQRSIGQHETSATPLQMALVAAAVANDGQVMEPYVVAQVRDDQDEVIDEADPEEWRTAMSPATADTLREAMVSVVAEGSARRLADGLGGYVVGGKTGTAQLGTDPPRSHAWIIGFAGPEGEAPHVAVTVLVEGQEGASEQTGGQVAAPIASAVMRQVLEPASPAVEGGEG